MKKKFIENPLLSEVLASYKKSGSREYLSFYEYCQVNTQLNQLSDVSEVIDQYKIDQAMESLFSFEQNDNSNGPDDSI